MSKEEYSSNVGGAYDYTCLRDDLDKIRLQELASLRMKPDALSLLKDLICPICLSRLKYDPVHYGYFCPNHINGQDPNSHKYIGCRFAWFDEGYYYQLKNLVKG